MSTPMHRGSDQRISHVESQLTGMKVEVTNLTNGFANFTAETRSQLSAIFAKLDSGGKTNWSVIAAWVAVSVTWIAMYTGLLLDPLKTTVMDNKALINKQTEQQRDDQIFAARLDERLKNLEKAATP